MLSDLEKFHFNQKLIEALRLRLVHKNEHLLPDDGVYYVQRAPHEFSTIGSLAAEPEPSELLSGFPPPPNSMGLIFLVVPGEKGIVELSLNGQFDLEHAYIPDITDMTENLIETDNGIRDRQDVLEAYKRYTVKFENHKMLIDTSKETAGQAKVIQDEIQENLGKLNKQLKDDPRVFLNRTESGEPGTRIRSIDWDESIIDQDSFNEVVRNSLFDLGSSPLPYNLQLECRYRRVPALVAESAREAILLELHLINHTTEELANRYRLYKHRVMDVRFVCSITRGEHTQMAFNLAPQEYRYRENQYVDGYGQACGLVRPFDNIIATDSMPRYEQPWLETPSADQVGMKQAPDFSLLATNPLPVLNELVDAMRSYESDWENDIQKLEESEDKGAKDARNDHQEFKQEIKRVQEGIDLLNTDGELMQSFCLMNETMGRAIELQRKSFTGWRLFQIGFILTQLRSVTERFNTIEENDKDCRSFADVLWFATGGGKTEAYMGLITTAMYYQRLKGREYGVTAWLRFPLRMLSVQQFQRLAYVLGQANEIKVENNIAGFPFTVGYFTGAGTPGRISSTADYAQSNYLPNLSKSPDELKKLQFINRCPHCGDGVGITAELHNFRIKHVCQNSECWSNTKAPTGVYGEGLQGELGIYISDEECYRYMPTVLVGTLDKAAVFGHNYFIDTFFGKSTHYCPDHGFIKQGKCKGAVIDEQQERNPCPNNSMTSATKTRALTPMKDPGFSYMISDELHLLAESLGNFNAHYESLIVELQCQSNGMPPKNLGATATIREYENHVNHLYLRRGRRFPVAGPTQMENFYTRWRKEGDVPLHRRLFVGLLPISVGPAPVVNVIADANARYHQLLDELKELAKTDPKKFSKGFEIDESKVDLIREHMIHNLQPSLLYAVKTADADQIMKRFEDDNAERRVNGLDELVEQRLDGHTDLSVIQDTIDIIETDDPNKPIHELVATSVVSHGVDIERLNMEFFTGWPKTTAEYLQSSSRSGRIHPGIVMVGLAYYKLFEYSVFSRFSEFHKFMDRLIEAVPINRFAPNVLSRTLPGIFNAVLFNWARHQEAWGSNINPYEAGTLKEALNSSPEANDALFEQVCACLCVEQARELSIFSDRMIDEFEEDLIFRTRRMINVFKNLPARYTKSPVADVLGSQLIHKPLQSFRDIEQQVAIEAENHDSKRVLASLSR